METTNFARIEGDRKSTARHIVELAARKPGSKRPSILGTLAVILFAALGVAVAVHSLEPAIHGTVRDAHGAPLSGVPVVFRGMGESSGRDFVIETDAKGAYAAVVPQGWTGSITLDSLRRIEPISHEMTSLSADAPGRDFVVCD